VALRSLYQDQLFMLLSHDRAMEPLLDRDYDIKLSVTSLWQFHMITAEFLSQFGVEISYGALMLLAALGRFWISEVENFGGV